MIISIRSHILILLGLISVSIFVGGIASQAVAKQHPVEVERMPLCSNCHTDGRTALDHRAGFITRHRFYAAQQRTTCDVCHAPAFCSDCHAHKEELKPSDKDKDAPMRSLPHRGDYLNQHKIDGRLDPASCFPCHGRQNNERCKVCHK